MKGRSVGDSYRIRCLDHLSEGVAGGNPTPKLTARGRELRGQIAKSQRGPALVRYPDATFLWLSGDILHLSRR